jgi:hypothetical protein
MSPQSALFHARAASDSAICSDITDIHSTVLLMSRLVILGSGVLKINNVSAADVVEFTEATNSFQSECLLNAARRLVPIRPTAPKANREGPFDEHESLGPGRNPVVHRNSVVKANPPPDPKHTAGWSLKHDTD